ncbi:MAG: glycosyltransferase family 39 protein [Nanoarchaeota archaeon]|nr:glycosyltransferase family 39 protein [Nanoarchaeota archaeon]
MDKYQKILLVIILISIVLRLLLLNHTIAFDEYVQTRAVQVHSSAGFDKWTGIAPGTTWTRTFVTWFTGVNIPGIRLTSLIFGLFSIVLVYLLAKALYDKKTAIWAAGLLGFSAWHMLGSTSISFDGAFLTFYYILTIACYVKFDKTSDNKWLYLTGIAFGLAMLTKYNAVLLIPILGLYALFQKHKIIAIIKQFSILILISILIFSIFPILAYLTDFSYFIVTLQHNRVFFGEGLNLALLLIQYVLAFLWMGPLFIGLYLLKLIKFKRSEILMHLWIWIPFLFFTFIIQENFRPLERYFFVFLPAICILGASYISGFKFNRKHLALFLIVFILFTGFLFFINLRGGDFLPFYPKTEFISAVKSLDWNIYMPFTGDQGPAGMYLLFSGIAYSFILSAVFLLLHLIYSFKNKKKIASTFFVLFFAIAFSYNIFMAQELIVNSTNPDINHLSKDVYDYANQMDLKQPLFYFRNYAARYYLEDKYSEIEILDFGIENDEARVAEVIGSQSHVVIVDFPTLDKNSLLWKELSNKCTLQKQFEDKGISLGFIFDCSMQK